MYDPEIFRCANYELKLDQGTSNDNGAGRSVINAPNFAVKRIVGIGFIFIWNIKINKL